MKNKKIFSIIVLCVVSIFLIAFYLATPQDNKEYVSDLSVLPGLSIDTFGSVQFEQLRDFAYENGNTSEQYSFQAYSVSDVQSATYHLQYLSDHKLTAHGFITFDMGERFGLYQHIGISIEARREVGENYSPLLGIFKQYELAHVWATERDLVSRRTDLYGKSVDSYPLQLSKTELEHVFKSLVLETIELEKNPRFYNTLTNNCVNALVRYINKNEDFTIPYHYSMILTGRSVQYLQKLGYIKK